MEQYRREEYMETAKDEVGDRCRCSFCGKTQAEVAKLIPGPAVFICNKCVGLCVDILRDDQIEPETRT